MNYQIKILGLSLIFASVQVALSQEEADLRQFVKEQETKKCMAASSAVALSTEKKVDTISPIKKEHRKRLMHDDSWPLLVATEIGDIATIKSLLAQGVSCNIKCSEGHTPLICASSRSQIDAMNLLLTHKAEVNHQDNEGASALFHVIEKAEKEKLDIARTLLYQRADPNVTKLTGMTPLMLAARYGYEEIVTLLLAHKADGMRTDLEQGPALFQTIRSIIGGVPSGIRPEKGVMAV